MKGLFLITTFVFGTIFGSFLSAWMWRAHHGKSIFKGRSACPRCGTTIAWFDLIPIISFFVLRGKCRTCGKDISRQYPLVELFLGVAFLCIGLFETAHGIVIFRDMFIMFFLTFVFVYDLRHQQILESATLFPALLLFIGTGVIFPWSIPSMLIGATVGGGVFLLQYLISRGTWIGIGDLYLGVFMGIILGWPLVIVAIIVAYVLGALVTTPLLLLKKKTAKSKVAFGTYLSLATVVVLFWGEYLVTWYLGLIL
jgi:prepilin signal peptidase PulO-like enzyme (type II secretory pathway)